MNNEVTQQVLISLARVMLFRGRRYSRRLLDNRPVLISLARVMLFRGHDLGCYVDLNRLCLNLSCESNAFQGPYLVQQEGNARSLNLSCESNAFQGCT